MTWHLLASAPEVVWMLLGRHLSRPSLDGASTPALKAFERLMWVTGHDRIACRDARILWLDGNDLRQGMRIPWMQANEIRVLGERAPC